MREIVKRETIGASIGVRERVRCPGAVRVRAASQCQLRWAEARAGKVGSPSGVLFIDPCSGARGDWKRAEERCGRGGAGVCGTAGRVRGSRASAATRRAVLTKWF